MGFYIQTDGPKNKVFYIRSSFGCTILPWAPERFDKIPENKALICVVDNGAFEAAGFAYSPEELEVFKTSGPERPRTWLLMDKVTAMIQSEYYKVFPKEARAAGVP